MSAAVAKPPKRAISAPAARTPKNLSRLTAAAMKMPSGMAAHASRLVAIIDSLEGRGLVARETDDKDRRIYCLRLTAFGREALAAIGRVARAHEKAVCEGLSEGKRAHLGSLLRKMAAHHGLAPGIHPGYKTLGAKQIDACGLSPRRKKTR